MNEEKYQDLRKKPLFAKVAELWKQAVETFPDEGLRKYFTDFDNFEDFYDRINEYFDNEEIRLMAMFDICPDLKSIATNPTEETAIAAENWSIKVDWI